ncbi:metallophosphoesterase [Exilibacterium tricleocarpae]|uniref:Metallophosphoesterase n=1 Tax=Exilibacterium tricleocarpae TaxID=2591008 RepID=A0A545T0H3_9GAMM|nr:metallophosphoesterase [Exilibacterium tricleocarpae]TQV70723.1 metallophosphoesterase [Exilibacterium tricleocarpae]
MKTNYCHLIIYRTLLVLAAAVLLSACNSSDKGNTRQAPAPTDPGASNPPVATFTVGLLPDTQGGTDTDGQAHVSMHPMSELLKHQAEAGVDMVLALGDLTDKGSTVEFAEWRSVADQYAESGIEFLPVMGNHETSYAYTYEWIKNMRDFIPEDATHMPGYEWVNYYVVRENVLIVGLAYYNLPVAFEWIKDVVALHEEKVEHIVVASHDGLIGAKYGQTREQIVDGTKDDSRVSDVQPKIREFFAARDVIYVQGHEHQYQRSLISAKTALTTYPSGHTPQGGNYRMDVYTQIMAGNASYKGYEFRYGERDLVQLIVAQKNATKSNGSTHYDVNSSLLRFTGKRVDYESYFSEHTASSNAPEEAFAADWKLLDKFSRTTDRCDTVVYANSILPETRPVMVLQPEYITNDCLGADGSYASLAGGMNNTFNRTDTRTRDMGYLPGFSRAETLNDLVRLNYQWLYQLHQRWSPNLNSAARVVPDYPTDILVVPETTVDLKEHVTLSWLPKQATASDILIVSGTQNQTGIYQDDYGVPKDIETDSGLALSQSDGTEKQPVALPETATKTWDISNAVADAYALVFTGPESLDSATVTLAQKDGDQWQPLSPADCIVDAPWSKAFLETSPARAAGCEAHPLVGLDKAFGNRWWAVLNRDIEVALVAR